MANFFSDNLTMTGFNPREIDDFIDYWIPKLTDHCCYAIYPQYNEHLTQMIQLDISVEPDNIIRVIYVIRALESGSLSLVEPTIPQFSREGFTVAEWGVILR